MSKYKIYQRLDGLYDIRCRFLLILWKNITTGFNTFELANHYLGVLKSVDEKLVLVKPLLNNAAGRYKCLYRPLAQSS